MGEARAQLPALAPTSSSTVERNCRYESLCTSTAPVWAFFIIMFKRPFTSKTQAPLRSSDVRKLREELLAFETLPMTSSLAKQLAPEGLLVCKAMSHLDEPLTLYSAGPDPRWFRIGKKDDGALIPTCYSCDLVPGLLPVLVTAPQVVPNLVSGAGERRRPFRRGPAGADHAPSSSVRGGRVRAIAARAP